MRKLLLTTLQIVFVSLILFVSCFGATDNVDAGFNPQLTTDVTINYYGVPVVQPDGKVIVYGSAFRSFVKRFNADGTIDPTFSCPRCLSFDIENISFQPDGKMIVSSGSAGVLIRINQNGSVDPSFKFTPPPNFSCSPYAAIAQPDGKVLVKCNSVRHQTNVRESLMRLDSSGKPDATFPIIDLPNNSSGFRPYAAQTLLLPDGRILIGGDYLGTGGGWLRRYNADGSPDSSFQVTSSSSIFGFGILPDGKYVVTGSFSSINGVTRFKAAKLNADGSVDTGFSVFVANDETASQPKILSNGRFYLRITKQPSSGSATLRFVRYNSDGSVDNTFSQTFPNGIAWDVDASSRIVTFKGDETSARFYRLNADGNVDAPFNPIVSGSAVIHTCAIQSDGKIVVSGEFDKANGINAAGITRLNADGTTDTTFNSGSGFNIEPDRLAIQPDGKILAAGIFTVFNGTPRSKLARLNADGSLDTAFAPTIDANVNAIVPLANGKILIGGTFRTVNGVSRVAVARLNADGSLDSAFNTTFQPPSTADALFVQSDGKIMVNIGRRLNSDGSFDSSFDPNLNSVSGVRQIFQRPDGKYLVLYKSSQEEGGIALINNNGSRDFSFRAGTNSFAWEIKSFFVQPSGNVVFGGKFGYYSFGSVAVNSFGFKNGLNIGRVGPNSVADRYFPTFGADEQVNQVIGQPDGKIIFLGDFFSIEDVERTGIARLTLSNRIRGGRFDYDNDTRADVSVFRPSTNEWFVMLSGNSSVNVRSFGASGDIPAPADYDGDGKTDLGIFRPSTGNWWYLSSIDNTQRSVHWGASGDIPRPGDFDGDGKADFIVYRPSSSVWYRLGSTGATSIEQFGISEDKPLVGDFDGDGKDDLAVYRPSTGTWWYAASSQSGQFRAVQWGVSSDIPVPADYDADGRTDFAVYRPSTGVWYIMNSSNGTYTILQFGLTEDKPVAADYDGDGKDDIAVFRPSTGIWYLLKSTEGFGALQFGASGDIPTPGAFVP